MQQLARTSIFFVVLLYAFAANSENLHRKHGPTWDCSYITTGLPYKDACLACEAQGKQFDRRGDGGICVGGGTANFPSPRGADYTQPRQGRQQRPSDVGTGRSPTLPQSTERQKWNSIAGTTRETSDGVSVGVGYAEGWSSQEAQQNARTACEGNGVPGCKALGAWNSGCVYITTGKAKDGRSVRAGYQGGATSSEASSKCSSRYDTCKTPIGGCVN
jgi:hypothetical protein